MIILENREFLIPKNERYLGTTYDDSVENRVFQLSRFNPSGTDISNLVFKLDLKYSDGSTDTADLVKEVSDENIVLVWNIDDGVLQVPGTVFAQIRAFDANGTVKFASFMAAMYVEDAINTPGTYTGDLTELEQLEAEMNQHLEDLAEYGLEAEAWAVGQRNGEDVDPDADQYHNNAKYYAQQAASEASDAHDDAIDAAASAAAAASSETNAAASKAAAALSETNAASSATSASGSATAAANSAAEAAGSETNAAASAAQAAIDVMYTVKFIPQTMTEAQKAQARDNIGVSGDVAVSSFNGRTGAVVPLANDYTAAMVGALPDDTPLLQLGETSSTAGRGDRAKTAYDHSQLTTGNPHNVTKANVGLGNVDNTSDLSKPVSTAQQTAIDGVKPLAFENVSVSTTAFVADATYEDFGYKAEITLTGVTADHFANVVFDPANTDIFAPICLAGAGKVTIYSSEVPASAITIPTITAQITKGVE